MKINVQKTLETCEQNGIYLWTEGDKLRFKAPKGAFTDELKAEVKVLKEEIMTQLRQLEQETITSDVAAANEPFLLTEVQASYLLGRETIYQYGGTGCHAYVEVRIRDCDLSQLQNALEAVVAKHDMLRAVIMRDGYQKVLADFACPVIQETKVDSLMTGVLEKRAKMSQRNYNCEQAPLFDVSITTAGDESVIHFSIDMLIADSISIGIILTDLLSFLREPGRAIEKPVIRFRDILLFDEIEKNKPSKKIKYAEDKAYWLARLDDFPRSPRLPMDASNQEKENTAEFIQYEYDLPAEQWAHFSAYAIQNGLTSSTALLSVYAQCLGMWAGNERFALNVTTMIRPEYHEDVGKVVGDFTRNVILEIDQKDESFVEQTARLQKRLWEDIEHSGYSGIEFLRELNRRKNDLVLMPYVYTSTLGISGLEDEAVDVLYRASRTPQVFIDCQVSETRSRLSVIWTVRKFSIDSKTTAILFKQFTETLERLAEDESLWSKALRIEISEEDRPYYETMHRQVVEEEQRWRLLHAPIDESACETILKEKLNVEDAAVISGPKVDVYLAPHRTSDESAALSVDQTIREQTAAEAEQLGTEVDQEIFAHEMEITDEFALLEIMRTFRMAGAFIDPEIAYDQHELEIMLQVQPQYKGLLARWLDALVRAGFIRMEDELYCAVRTDIDAQAESVKQKAAQLKIGSPGTAGMEAYILSSGQQLADSISGRLNPVEFLFPQGDAERAHEIYHDLFAAKVLNMLAIETVRAIAEDRKQLKILEVGSGVGGTSDALIPFLKKYDRVEYYFTDISHYFLQEARSKYTDFPFVKCQIYDLNRHCYEQGFLRGSFDIIVSANTFHNAIDGYLAMEMMREALKPDGYILYQDCIFESNSLLASKGMLHTGEIRDSRKAGRRIFFTEEEWLRMFEHTDLEVVYAYPPADDYFAKSNLKYYVVRNRHQYILPDLDAVPSLLADLVGLPERLGQVTVSQVLPKQADGRLDKSKLSIGASVDTRKSKGSAEPPADELEEAILQIWQEVLEIDDAVGVTDSFFDLGGDSLLASMTVTKMRSRVKEAQAVDWNDLMNLLLKNNTVRKLAAALREGDSQDGPETPDYVTVYQKGADQPHKLWAFFVNGNATMTIYKTMLELLKSKISANDQVVGFHCGDPERFLALKTEDVIDCMARRNCAFLETQNAETHQLIGHCFGGAVAIETARLLQAHNVQNVRVTTIDSRRLRGRFDNPLFFEKAFGEMYGVDMSRCGYEIDDELHKGAMAEFLEKHGHFPTIEEACEASDLPKEVRDCYRALASKPVEERLQRIFAQLEGRLQDGLDKVYFMNSYRLFLKILSAFSLYDPIPYDGDVETYICRDLSGFFLPSDDVETMDYAKDALVKVGERLWVDGDHYSCLESPNVETIVERL